MVRFRSRLLLASCLAGLALFTAFPAVPLSAAVSVISGSVGPLIVETETPLERQVHDWVKALAAQSAFAAWKTAAADIQALGPGTHAWLAILKADGRPVGYLVIHAKANGGFALGEYGIGPNILFDELGLKRSLAENGLIGTKQAFDQAERLYYHPFAAVWEVSVGNETYWFDAKTNELLPFDRTSWERHLPALETAAAAGAASLGTVSRPESFYFGDTFDPYEKLPWLTGKPPFDVRNEKKVQGRIRGGLHLKYVSEPYGDAALYAVPVTGYLKWEDGRLDLALDMAGSRFIPMGVLRPFGSFYT